MSARVLQGGVRAGPRALPPLQTGSVAARHAAARRVDAVRPPRHRLPQDGSATRTGVAVTSDVVPVLRLQSWNSVASSSSTRAPQNRQ